MTPEAKDLLNIIDEFLVKHAGELPSREVATVLSAIRGDDMSIKPSSTGHIPKEATMAVRTLAFPKACVLYDIKTTLDTVWANYGRPEKVPSIIPMQLIDKAGPHFSSHVIAALQVLGWKRDDMVGVVKKG